MITGLHHKTQRLPSSPFEAIAIFEQRKWYTFKEQPTAGGQICKRRLSRGHAGSVCSACNCQSSDLICMTRFGGDPAPNGTTDPNTDSESTPSLLDKVKLGVAETAKSFMLDMWLARQTQEKVLPILQRVIEGAKEEFADAVANGGGLYAVGYCFGGKYVLLLGAEIPDAVAKGQATEDEEQGMTKSGPQIKAGALAHGEKYLRPLYLCEKLIKDRNLDH